MFLFGRFLIQVLHTEWQILHFVLCFIPTNSAFNASLNHDLMSMPDKGKGRGGGRESLPEMSLCLLDRNRGARRGNSY